MRRTRNLLTFLTFLIFLTFGRTSLGRLARLSGSLGVWQSGNMTVLIQILIRAYVVDGQRAREVLPKFKKVKKV